MALRNTLRPPPSMFDHPSNPKRIIRNLHPSLTCVTRPNLDVPDWMGGQCQDHNASTGYCHWWKYATGAKVTL